MVGRRSRVISIRLQRRQVCKGQRKSRTIGPDWLGRFISQWVGLPRVNSKRLSGLSTDRPDLEATESQTSKWNERKYFQQLPSGRENFKSSSDVQSFLTGLLVYEHLRRRLSFRRWKPREIFNDQFDRRYIERRFREKRLRWNLLNNCSELMVHCG